MIFRDNKPIYLDESEREVPFSYYLRIQRNKTGLSQVQFAKHLGVNVHTLRAWEQGKSKSNPGVAVLLASDPTFTFSSNGFQTTRSAVPFRYGLRAFRHSRRWSRKQLAAELDVSPTTLDFWEQGKHKPSPFNMYKITLLMEETC